MGLEEKTRRAKLLIRLGRLLDEYSHDYEITDTPGALTISYPTPEVEAEAEAEVDAPAALVTLTDLKRRASELKISGRSKLSRAQLEAAIAAAEAAQAGETDDEGAEAGEGADDDTAATEGDDSDS